ncbi:MAG: 4'-phosphopantetheinyl transferase superfamily protein [Gammaproteobacteria bacterium]|nr:4'-phosphopantetheinyl transferase superfamily protein [Gammaproteobacteria bacterium]
MSIWQKPVQNPMTLSQGMVHLWQAHLPLDGDVYQYESILSPDELERGRRFIKKSDQVKFILSKGITRKILSRYLHCPPEKIVFSVGEHGKPFVADVDLQFNVSHSGEYLLIGVVRENTIGVDIECEKKNTDFLGLAKRFFTPFEYEAILNASDQRAAFYRCWVFKEAFIKTTGLGLSFGLENFEVDVMRSSLLSISDKRFSSEVFVLGSITLDDPSYYGAFSVKGDVGEVVYWRF